MIVEGARACWGVRTTLHDSGQCRGHSKTQAVSVESLEPWEGLIMTELWFLSLYNKLAWLMFNHCS